MDHMKGPNTTRLEHKGDESHLLREIIRANQVLMHGFSRATGMPVSRFALLRQLATAGGQPGVMDLARQLGIDPAAVARQVKEMEQEGVLRREADPRDRRRSCVELTPEGHRLFAAIHERSHELEREISKHIRPEEAAMAAAVLAKLREVVEGAIKEGVHP